MPHMRKLSFEENLRHRLRDLPRLQLREEKSSTEGLLFLTLGAVVGIAAGVVLAQRYGGFSALTSRIRDRFGMEEDEDTDAYESDDADYGDDDEEEYTDLSPAEELEERVLETFHNDPILCERAVDIGAIDDGIIELTGWVYSPDEATHAVTLARGTPGVDTVVNRLAVRAEEEGYETRAEEYEEDDLPAEGHWEGQQVGTGRRRQGTSQDPERHADPKVPLEERWMSESEAYRAAAEPIEGQTKGAQTTKTGTGKGAKSAASGDRTDGAPVAPTGVPKADHVADPMHAPQTDGTGNTQSTRGD